VQGSVLFRKTTGPIAALIALAVSALRFLEAEYITPHALSIPSPALGYLERPNALPRWTKLIILGQFPVTSFIRR
jgi:hypothetical protein